MSNDNTEKRMEGIEAQLPPEIDESQFKPMTSAELVEILGLTVKKDEINKLCAFLCQLSAYTEDSQFNVSFNAPSSTGKSYIPTEIARLFPQEDVKELGYCSPSAFWHEVGIYDKERNSIIVDFSRKIIIFLDQPHNQLLARLRPLLSHDKKELVVKITDKSFKGGNRTKTVILIGFPAVTFCTAGLTIDEQEATRFLMLSPEINAEKIRQAISEKIRRSSDSEAYKTWLEENPERRLLKERIMAIKLVGIKDIKIKDTELLTKQFYSKIKTPKPRHTRDIGRLISLVKTFALLNLWWRERENDCIMANQEDIQEAFKVWDAISESQELNLPPYILDVYKRVILAAWKEKNSQTDATPSSMLLEEVPKEKGLTKQDIFKKHYQVYSRYLPEWQLRQEILPMLETAGLLVQEKDPGDKRLTLIYPTNFTPTPESKEDEIL